MALWPKFLTRGKSAMQPRAAYQADGGGVTITTSQDLDDYVRHGGVTASGQRITPETAMGIATVFGCVRLISGSVATLPLQVKRRIDARTREDASDTPLAKLLKRPNGWQTGSGFRRMQQAHLLLRGRAFALKVTSMGRVIQLIPLNPDRVKTKQNPDMTLSYEYTRLDGRVVVLQQHEMMHWTGLTLDGFEGVSVLTYARESMGSALAATQHGATVFKNGASISGVLTHPGLIGAEATATLKASMDEYRSGGERDAKTLVLEEGMKFEKIGMSMVDAQWIDSQKFSRSEIAMFFGVPPHMLGIVEGNTSLGSSLSDQSQGYVDYTLNDHLVVWEDTIERDLTNPNDNLYARFNRAALVKGDIEKRWRAYSLGRQIEVYSANDIRALEDLNPIEGGDVYANPLINTKDSQGQQP